ncbi:IS3 family transposase [Peribacillus sp. NPDC006672]
MVHFFRQKLEDYIHSCNHQRIKLKFKGMSPSYRVHAA